MDCPNCHHEIGNSTYCGCGWKRTKPTKTQTLPRGPCAHANCEKPARAGMKTNTGWANLCERHYELLIQTRAGQICQRLGLTTTKQKHEWLRTYMKTAIANMHANIPREPEKE